MNITNIERKRVDADSQRWDFYLNGEPKIYYTSRKESVVATGVLIRNKSMQGSPFICEAKVDAFLPLTRKTARAGIERFYKLLMLQ